MLFLVVVVGFSPLSCITVDFISHKKKRERKKIELKIENVSDENLSLACFFVYQI